MNDSKFHRTATLHWQTIGTPLVYQIDSSILPIIDSTGRYYGRVLALYEPWVIPIRVFELVELID